MNSYCQLYFTLTSGCTSGGRLRSRRWPQIIYNFPNLIPISLSSEPSFIYLFFFPFSFSAPSILQLTEAGTLTRNDRSLHMSHFIVCCTFITFPASSFKISPTQRYMFLICITEKSCLFYSLGYFLLVQWIFYSIVESSTSSTDLIWFTTQWCYYCINKLVKPGLDNIWLKLIFSGSSWPSKLQLFSE